MKKIFFALLILFNYSVFAQNDLASMDKVFEESKGKLIYVEFWASWCEPCRKEMKKVHKLMDKYKDRVSFVFFSIDLDENEWNEASKKEKIDAEKYNFMISKIKKSDKMKGLGFSSIPKYAIFDKDGKLVNKDAPRPSNKKIHEEFEKYL